MLHQKCLGSIRGNHRIDRSNCSTPTPPPLIPIPPFSFPPPTLKLFTNLPVNESRRVEISHCNLSCLFPESRLKNPVNISQHPHKKTVTGLYVVNKSSGKETVRLIRVLFVIWDLRYECFSEGLIFVSKLYSLATFIQRTDTRSSIKTHGSVSPSLLFSCMVLYITESTSVFLRNLLVAHEQTLSKRNLCEAYYLATAF